MPFEQIFFIILSVWLVLLTAGLGWFFKRFSFLVKDAKGKSLLARLNQVLALEKKNEKKAEDLSRAIEKLEKEAELSVRKVGLVRFNPFNETGGDHSFSAALLNTKDTGIVLTGLHTRERTRLYLKSIQKGKSKYDLSKEEGKAIEKARKGIK